MLAKGYQAGQLAAIDVDHRLVVILILNCEDGVQHVVRRVAVCDDTQPGVPARVHAITDGCPRHVDFDTVPPLLISIKKSGQCSTSLPQLLRDTLSASRRL